MFLFYQHEDGQWKGPKHVVVLYVINYTYLYHNIVVLDRYTNSNLVYYKLSGDDEPYEWDGSFWLPCCLLILVSNKLFLWSASQVPSPVPVLLHLSFCNMPVSSWESFKPIILYLIIFRRFPVVSFRQIWSNFRNLYGHRIHMTFLFCSLLIHSALSLCCASSPHSDFQ